MKTSSKKLMEPVFMLVVAATLMCSCSDKPGGMDDPAPEVGTFVLSDDAINGERVTGIPNGVYDLIFNVKGDQGSYRVFAVDANTGQAVHSCITTPMNSTTWTKAMMPTVSITDGTIQLKGAPLEATNGSTAAFTGIRLVQRTDETAPIITGGDVSQLTKVENAGGKFYDQDGNEGDCLEIMRNAGMNMVRLRLFVEPGATVFIDSTDAANWKYYRLPEYYQGEEDIMKLASRAKALGFDIELTLNYSDYWADVSAQEIPASWHANWRAEGIDSLHMESLLKDSLYSYTTRILKRMEAQGTAPAMVSIGNETMNGILYPFASGKNPLAMSRFFSSASKAIRDACPTAKVLIHLNASYGSYEWFLNIMKQYAFDYDIIGISYYPFWAFESEYQTAEDIVKFAESLYDTYGKKIMFLETGFSWNPTMPSGGQGQISHNGIYDKLYKNTYGVMTKEAQLHYMIELTQAINMSKDHCILGYLYWDPIYLDLPNCGWAEGGEKTSEGTFIWKSDVNVTANSTIFDFSGKALPVFDAIKYNR